MHSSHPANPSISIDRHTTMASTTSAVIQWLASADKKGKLALGKDLSVQ